MLLLFCNHLEIYNEKVSDGIYLSINTGLTRMPIFPSGHDGRLLAGTFTRVRAHGGRGWRTMPRTGSMRSDMPPVSDASTPSGPGMPMGGAWLSENKLSKREPGPQVVWGAFIICFPIPIFFLANKTQRNHIARPLKIQPVPS